MSNNGPPEEPLQDQTGAQNQEMIAAVEDRELFEVAAPPPGQELRTTATTRPSSPSPDRRDTRVVSRRADRIAQSWST
jgi:hypothetical protein